MGIMRCANKSCNALMAAGQSKCGHCGKKTYFYWKHPHPILMILFLLLFSPFFIAIALVVKLVMIPFKLANMIKNKLTKNHSDI